MVSELQLTVVGFPIALGLGLTGCAPATLQGSVLQMEPMRTLIKATDGGLGELSRLPVGTTPSTLPVCPATQHQAAGRRGGGGAWGRAGVGVGRRGDFAFQHSAVPLRTAPACFWALACCSLCEQRGCG